MLSGSDYSFIRRARLVGSRDGLAAGSRLARMLAGEDLTPPGLPSGALLVVRRLQATPVTCTGHELCSPSPWVRAIGSELARLSAAASYPADFSVPASAEAVVFRNRADLLTCLARDWISGEGSQRWWWRTLLPNGMDAGAVADIWREHAEFVPPALHALQRDGSAARLLVRLDARAVGALTEAVVTRFGLEKVRGAMSGFTAGSAAALPQASAQARQARREEPATPWRRTLAAPEAEALDPLRHLLLGVCITLHRATATARSPEFAAEVKQWLGKAGSGAPRPTSDATLQPLPLRSTEETDRKQSASVFTAHSQTADEAPRAGPRDAAAYHTPLTSVSVVRPVTSSPGPLPNPARAPENASASDGEDHPPLHASGAFRRVAGRSIAAGAARTPAAFPEAGERIRTRFGGVFYLANLALFLELYGDFSRPLHWGLDLPFWDFLALAGEALVGTDIRYDPVWVLLALLSGRPPRSAPGRGWKPPGEWRLPPAWLAPFPSADPCSWHSSGGRLRVVHPAGFTVLDLPLAGSPAADILRREWESYPPLTLEAAKGRPDSAYAIGRPGLRRWLGWLVPFLRARLRLALGLPAGADPGPLFCLHAAEVLSNAAALDVHLRLDDHPIEIRIAGLDRDPGWVPAAGRSIRFRFG